MRFRPDPHRAALIAVQITAVSVEYSLARLIVMQWRSQY